MVYLRETKCYQWCNRVLLLCQCQQFQFTTFGQVSAMMRSLNSFLFKIFSFLSLSLLSFSPTFSNPNNSSWVKYMRPWSRTCPPWNSQNHHGKKYASSSLLCFFSIVMNQGQLITKVREARLPQNGWFFRKITKVGEGASHFRSKTISLQFRKFDDGLP